MKIPSLGLATPPLTVPATRPGESPIEVVDSLATNPAPLASPSPSLSLKSASAPSLSPVTEVVAEPTPPPRAVERNARSLGVLLRRMEAHLSPLALHELRSNAELVAVLSGQMGLTRVAAEGKAADDLKALVECLGVVTRQALSLRPDPQHLGQVQVLNRGRSEDAEQLVDPWTPRALQAAEQLNHQGRSLAVDCLAASQKVGQPLASKPGALAQVGMIGYIDSAEGVQRFASVLREWRQNLEDFGHRGVVFRLCDDSPEPYGSQIRRLLQEQGSESVRFEYLGRDEKLRLRQNLEQELSSSMSVEDARAVAALMAGPGATQNRNLSLQLLGPSGGLQMDHDMTPEVLTSHWEDPLPFDILGNAQQFHSEPGIRSYAFSGADDVSIEYILSHGRRLPQNRVSGLEGRGDNSVRGPMLIPQNLPGAARIAPGLRDGDLALTKLSQKVAQHASSGLPDSIYHRDPAGGRWNGGELVRQFLLLVTCNQALSAWVGEADQGDAARVGQALLNGLASNASWSSLEDSRFLQRVEGPLRDYLAGLSGDDPERQRARQQLCLDEQGNLDLATLEASLQQEARTLLRTQALALIHSQQIADCLRR